MLFNGKLVVCQFPMLFNVNLRLEKLLGGDVRTYVRTDVWKFTPVSYRTSALWGRCPKRVDLLIDLFFLLDGEEISDRPVDYEEFKINFQLDSFSVHLICDTAAKPYQVDIHHDWT